jgi:metal-dependent hydrolase (beta-lactamase superfamily II)
LDLPPQNGSQKTSDAFDAFRVNVVAPCHCTGRECYALFGARFEEQFARMFNRVQPDIPAAD